MKVTAGRMRIVAVVNWQAVTVSGSDSSPVPRARIV
jgi:hypothetical protein